MKIYSCQTSNKITELELPNFYQEVLFICVKRFNYTILIICSYSLLINIFYNIRIRTRLLGILLTSFIQQLYRFLISMLFQISHISSTVKSGTTLFNLKSFSSEFPIRPVSVNQLNDTSCPLK